MFSSFFAKTQQEKPRKEFVFPEHPCYAAVTERHLEVDLEQYFSGALDARLAIVKLFDNVADAVKYLKDKPSAKGGYLLCLDESLQDIEKIRSDKNGFGSRIVKAIDFKDYVCTTWQFHPLPPERVRITDNPHYKPKTASNPAPSI